MTGNPLSLVPDADGLAESQLRAIAREFNQSETTFVLRPSKPDATLRLRSFTPIGAEVFGAGHNALGAWLWLAHADRLPAVGTLTQEIGDEVLPVEVSRGHDGLVSVTMAQSAPRFGGVAGDRAELAASLGLAEADLVPDQPAQVVDTGAGHLLVPLRDRAAVDRAVPATERLAAVLRQAGGEGCYLYSRDPSGGLRSSLGMRSSLGTRSRTRGSSIRPWASPRTRPPGPRPGPWSPGWSLRGRSRTAARSSWSRVSPSDGPAGSRCR